MKLKSFILLAIIVCSTLVSQASQHTVDSLINLIEEEKSDSVLLKLYNNIGSASFRIDQLLAKRYWEMALKMANEKIKLANPV